MDIAFNSSPTSSLGVEVELEVVDRESRQLASAASSILSELGEPHGEGGHPKAKHELFECTVEIITGVCTTVAEARADLETTLAEVDKAAQARGLALMCSGTHPFSHYRDQTISPNPRYEQLVNEMAWMARRLQIFGIHYHVGVRSPEKAVAIANALAFYIPHFLALSASSPFWNGFDTGLASSRSKVFEGLPTAGLAAPDRELGRLRAVHGDTRVGRRHRHDPRGVVGHPPAPAVRHGRAAHVRRHPDAGRGGEPGGAGAEPGRVARHAHRPRLQAAHAPRMGRAPEQVAGGPPRPRRRR